MVTTRLPRGTAAARSIAAGSDCHSRRQCSHPLRRGQMVFRRGPAWGYYPDAPELLAAVIVTLTRPLPSLYWEWRLWAGVRPGGWIGSAPGLKAGERAAEGGFWRVGGAAIGGSRAPRGGTKSQNASLTRRRKQ